MGPPAIVYLVCSFGNTSKHIKWEIAQNLYTLFFRDIYWTDLVMSVYQFKVAGVIMIASQSAVLNSDDA